MPIILIKCGRIAVKNVGRVFNKQLLFFRKSENKTKINSHRNYFNKSVSKENAGNMYRFRDDERSSEI